MESTEDLIFEIGGNVGAVGSSDLQGVVSLVMAGEAEPLHLGRTLDSFEQQTGRKAKTVVLNQINRYLILMTHSNPLKSAEVILILTPPAGYAYFRIISLVPFSRPFLNSSYINYSLEDGQKQAAFLLGILFACCWFCKIFKGVSVKLRKSSCLRPH